MSTKGLKIRIFANYVISTISIVLVLSILGILILFLFNTQDFIKKIKENIVITVLLDSKLTENQIDSIEKKLQKLTFVNSIKYTSAQEALEKLETGLGQDIYELLGYNPLPPSFDITLKEKYANQDSIFLIKQNLLQIKGIDQVFYNQAIVNQLDKNIKSVSKILVSLAILMFVIVIVLINNTIRLLIYSKRYEIKIMQLVGASWWFILKPFFKSGLIHGVLSSLIAIIFLIAILLTFKFSGDFNFYVQHTAESFLIVFVIGTLITLISTVFIVFSYIRKPLKEIYI